MSKAVLSRRDLLRGGALGIGALAGLSACSKHKAISCAAVDGLSVEEILPRNKLLYSDVAADPAKTCSTCQQFVPPPSEDRCGSCKIMKGPVHPGGSCKSYVAKG
jgi:hypothetical protein